MLPQQSAKKFFNDFQSHPQQVLLTAAPSTDTLVEISSTQKFAPLE